MLRLYEIQNGLLAKKEPPEEKDRACLARAAWIDAHDPDPEQRRQLNTFLRTELPDPAEVDEIEASARYFIDDEGMHIYSLFLTQREGRFNTASVAFILQDERLLSLREGPDVADFRLLRMRIRRREIEVTTPKELLLTIFEHKIENLADAIEDIFGKLETVSHRILEDENSMHEENIDQLTKLEDSNGKIRLCLMDTQRSLAFLQRHLRKEGDPQQSIRDMMRDMDSLLSHTNFLFDKINFLMDAALGFINIEQNQIIKTFSVAAVVFMPPTVIASIYGMNFRYMPEIDWLLGYPAALVLMVLSAIAPYWIFKYKGWL